MNWIIKFKKEINVKTQLKTLRKI